MRSDGFLKKTKEYFNMIIVKDRTIRPRVTRAEHNAILEMRNSKNILFIGDIHAPFMLPEYVDHCQRIADKYSCDTVICLGDLIDNHYSSFHDTDPDGHSAAVELEKALEQIDLIHNAFPEITTVIGNHDRIPQRRLFNAGLTSKWMKDISEIITYPGWKFTNDILLNNDILVSHGDDMKAITKVHRTLMSVINGHRHFESEIKFFQGHGHRRFAMQVGCGVNMETYAMKYAKGQIAHHNVGVLLNYETPILEYMD